MNTQTANTEDIKENTENTPTANTEDITENAENIPTATSENPLISWGSRRHPNIRKFVNIAHSYNKPIADFIIIIIIIVHSYNKPIADFIIIIIIILYWFYNYVSVDVNSMHQLNAIANKVWILHNLKIFLQISFECR